jgi:hypothetical protein
MSGPRLSIIPAGAVTDRSLEGRDLQVLCLLGRHIDKGGWCVRSQVRMARELGCGRSSVQRSLDRLYTAGWVERRQRGEILEDGEDPGRPSVSHAYRVRLDRDDSEWKSAAEDDSDSHAETALQEVECPPVGTEKHHSEEGVPSHGGHGGAQPYAGTGAHTYMGTKNDPLERPLSERGGDSARAKPPISPEAHAFADELALIAGHDPQFLPPQWVSAGPGYRVQMMLDHGWRIETMRQTARAMMQRKRDGPPVTIRYFEKSFARAHAQQPPLPAAGSHGSTTPSDTTNWQRRRDRQREALAELGAFVDAHTDGSGNQGGGGGS